MKKAQVGIINYCSNILSLNDVIQYYYYTLLIIILYVIY